MKLQISHKTQYIYSGNVFFEPHFFRFKPKNTTHSNIIGFELKTDPEPAGYSEQIDIENNNIRLYWFDGNHKNLKISVKTTIDVSEFNPYNFLVYPPEYLVIPFKYNKQTRQLLNPSLQTTALSKQLLDFLDNELKKSNNQTIKFLTDLTKQIHSDFILETRETGEPLDPALAYELKRGSCRDLAWMQIHMLRHLGIAARFVSGYFYLDSKNPEYELHAWVEAFLPGAGWIGLDPGHGILSGSYHISLASSAFFENTMPVSGSIRGDASAIMKNELKMALI